MNPEDVSAAAGTAAFEAPCVSSELLERAARSWPDLVLLRFDSGEQYTSVQLLHAVRREAALLQSIGVRQGELVLSWLPNGPAAVLTWLAVNLLGAVHVPINTAYRGRLLEHVIEASGASLMVADASFMDRLAGVGTSKLDRIVTYGAITLELPGVRILSREGLAADRLAPAPPPHPLRPSDTQCVIFTSGTTGPSKGVLCSYRHTFTAATEFRHVGPGDTNLVALPLFHVGGILGINFALIHGGTAVVVERFRTQTFWDTIRRFEVTAAGLLGTMVQFLMQQPAGPGERDHPLRKVVIAPFGDEALAFAQRFGVQVFTEFNMTELSVPLWAGPDTVRRGACGRPRAGLQLRLVDERDEEVAVGEVGELILRTDRPWSLSHGYLNDPEATARAWRNGWFHTGDLFRRDPDDNYFFVDRAKDMIRRRGENISSFEVEAELLAFPGVHAAAAVPVPGDGGEDEVLAVLCPQAGHTMDPAALLEFLEPRLPAFMLPRYVRSVALMPLTPTQKIEKHVLRATGVTPDTWDRNRETTQARPSTPIAADLTRLDASDVAPSRNDPAGAGAGAGADADAGRSGPLRGIRVLEFAGLGPAPFCAMLFADLGADVVCIEKPGTVRNASDVEWRGRTRVQLDLKTPAHQGQALALMDHADVLLEGFRPGVMERLGLGPDVAAARNRRLVYARMTGWGQTGPLALQAGHDLNYLALTGALHALGSRDRPAVPLNLIADFGGGALYLALGVLAALHHARDSGRGQVVDAAMTDGVISLMAMIYGDFSAGRWLDQRESNVIDGGAPFYNVYRCRDGRWLSVAALESPFHRDLCEGLAATGAISPEQGRLWQSQQWDRATWPVVKQQMEQVFATRDRDAWCEALAGRDACIAPVLSLEEARQHAQNRERGSFVELAGVLQPAPAPRLETTPGKLDIPPGLAPVVVEDVLRRWR